MNFGGACVSNMFFVDLVRLDQGEWGIPTFNERISLVRTWAFWCGPLQEVGPRRRDSQRLETPMREVGPRRRDSQRLETPIFEDNKPWFPVDIPLNHCRDGGLSVDQLSPPMKEAAWRSTARLVIGTQDWWRLVRTGVQNRISNKGRYANSTAVPVVKTNGSQSDRRTLQRSGWEVAPLVDQWQWKPPKSVDFKHENRNAAMWNYQRVEGSIGVPTKSIHWGLEHLKVIDSCVVKHSTLRKACPETL